MGLRAAGRGGTAGGASACSSSKYESSLVSKASNSRWSISRQAGWMVMCVRGACTRTVLDVQDVRVAETLRAHVWLQWRGGVG